MNSNPTMKQVHPTSSTSLPPMSTRNTNGQHTNEHHGNKRPPSKHAAHHTNTIRTNTAHPHCSHTTTHIDITTTDNYGTCKLPKDSGREPKQPEVIPIKNKKRVEPRTNSDSDISVESVTKRTTAGKNRELPRPPQPLARGCPSRGAFYP